MRRRELIFLLGGTAFTRPVSSGAQQKAMPVIGVLSPASYDPFSTFVTAFRQGLSEAGYVEGENLAIEYRFAEGHYDRLPALAAVSQRVVAALGRARDLFWAGGRGRWVGLAPRHAVPWSYGWGEFPAPGGLISYGPSLTSAFRRVGHYAGRVLKGAKPADLPVQQPTTFELVINLKTAEALGLTVPQSMLMRANEVIN